LTSLVLARWLLLAFAGLAVLTALAMHGLVRRLILPYIASASKASRGVISLPLKMFGVMIGRAWIFRLYHACFAAVLFAGWWYLGTAAGQTAWTQLVAHP
jgi:hypothetical protein